MTCWRSLFVRLGLSCVLGVGLLTATAAAEEKETLEHTAALLHERVWTIDTHVDTPMRLMGQGFDIGVRHDVRRAAAGWICRA